MGLTLNTATHGEHIELSQSESPTWRSQGLDLQNRFSKENILATDLVSTLATPYSDGLIQLIHWAEKYPSQSDGFCQVGNSASSRKGQFSNSKH